MYAIDVGGTNFRIMYVHLADAKSSIVSGSTPPQAVLSRYGPAAGLRRCILDITDFSVRVQGSGAVHSSWSHAGPARHP